MVSKAHRERADALKKAAVERGPGDLRKAQRAFRRLDRREKLSLTQEIAEIRGAELCLAYDNLLSVGFGYKTKRESGRRKERLVREPCVVFVVSRKWRTKGRDNDKQRLPSHLYAYAVVEGERTLCAVPTDVKPLAQYGAAAKPHQEKDHSAIRPFGVGVTRAGHNEPEMGAVTCALKRPSAPGSLFALSCRHLFSMTRSGGDTPSNCEVRVIRDKSLIGKTVDVRGLLVGKPAISFDAQLARVNSSSALAQTLPGMRFEPGDSFAREPKDIPHAFWILTPRSDGQGRRLKVWVDFHDYVTITIPYGNLQVVHFHIMHAVASEQLAEGDSGSPAVPVAAGKKLLGMYLGGDGTNAYIIPAWQLLNPANYERSDEKGWTVTNP